jgi:hypothetical protein
MIVALFTDSENREKSRRYIDLLAGESRGDIQFVLGVCGEFTDFPDDYEHLSNQELEPVAHPTRVGESVESFGVVRLTRLP